MMPSEWLASKASRQVIALLPPIGVKANEAEAESTGAVCATVLPAMSNSVQPSRADGIKCRSFIVVSLVSGVKQEIGKAPGCRFAPAQSSSCTPPLPEMVKIHPLIQLAAGEHKNSAAWAMSCSSPSPPMDACISATAVAV